MKKRYVQKMTTILLTAAMICSSVPVTAETVSENEAVVETEAVDNTQNDSAENEQTDADINKEGAYAGEYRDGNIEENRADMDADYEQEDQEDTKIEDGTEGDLSYSIYQKSDGTKYAVITDCDESAEGAIEIPKEIKGIVVTSIGEDAFCGCRGLTSITILEGVTSIGYSAFSGCSGLTSITVEAGNMVYDSRDNCNAIIEKETNMLISGCENTKISASVTGIGDSAFSGCSGLTSITVEAGNMAYDSRDNCNAIIEKGTNTLIKGCNNTKIPVSVTGIGDDAFSYCNGLTSIEIPEGVTSIGSYTFSDSSLTSITIPASVESIGYSSFSDCRGLKDIYYTGTQEQWNDIKFYDYRDNEVDASYVFYYYDEDLDESVLIPYTLHCNSSESIPSATPSVTPSQKPSAAPSAAPSQQPSPTPSAVPSKTPEADVPAAGTTLKEKTGREFKVIKSNASESKPSVMLTKLSAKDKKAKKVTIPKTVTVDNVKYQVTGIAAKAFKNSKKLQTVVIPDTVTEIGTGSFEGCKNLKSVTIGKNAFKNCKNLKKITVKSTKLKKVGKGALTGINKKCVIKVPKKQLKSYKSLFKGKGQKKSVKITK